MDQNKEMMKNIFGLLIISVVLFGCKKSCYDCKTSWSTRTDLNQSYVVQQKSSASEEFCVKNDPQGEDVANHESENSFEYTNEDGEYIIQAMTCIEL